MRNRLKIAKELLKEDGVIFVQCDDNEQAYLKVLMDELFGRDNFINVISARMKNIAGASGGGKNKGVVYEQFYKGDKLRLLAWLKDVIEIKDQVILKKDLQGTFWDGFNLNNLSKEGDTVFESGKKPEELVKKVLDIATLQNDVVLDFHLGSGTTAAVSHKMNRQYITIEQMDYIETVTIARLKKVINGEQGGISKSVNWKGGGSFVYCELARANQEFIDQITEAKDTQTLFSIWKTMQEKAFISYKVDISSVDKNVPEFEELSLEDQKRFLIEVLDKNMLYVPYTEIDDVDYQISDMDKKLNREFYGK